MSDEQDRMGEQATGGVHGARSGLAVTVVERTDAGCRRSVHRVRNDRGERDE